MKSGLVPEMGSTPPTQYYTLEYRAEIDATGIAELAQPANELSANDMNTWSHQKRAELDSTPLQEG
jgi:hypothetical protein